MIRCTLCLIRDVIDVLYPPPPCERPHYVSLNHRVTEAKLKVAEAVIASQAKVIEQLRNDPAS